MIFSLTGSTYSETVPQILCDMQQKYHYTSIPPGHPMYHHGRSFSHEGVAPQFREPPADEDGKNKE